MKKVFISLGSLVALLFIAVLFVNAIENKKETRKNKKAQTEMKMQSSKCCSSDGKSASGEAADKKSTCCDKKEAKSDAAACAEHKGDAATEAKCCAGTGVKKCSPGKETGTKE